MNKSHPLSQGGYCLWYSRYVLAEFVPAISMGDVQAYCHGVSKVQFAGFCTSSFWVAVIQSTKCGVLILDFWLIRR